MGEAKYNTNIIPLVILCRQALVCDFKLSVLVVLHVEICCKIFLHIPLFYCIFVFQCSNVINILVYNFISYC